MSNVVKYLHSGLVGAPVLSGQAGAMISLLDTLLVNGFGSVTLDSLVIAGGIATATRAAGHPFEVDSVALVAGATHSGGGTVNGEVRVLTVPSANVFTFAVPGVSDQTAGGTLTAKFAPLGWSNTAVAAGTNVTAYKSTNVAATQMLLRVDDTGTTYARVVGYEAMSDINTGTGPFPTAAQISGGGHWPKSSAADATARDWVLVGDDKTFYLHVRAFNTAATTSVVGFGDFASRKPVDAYCAFINVSSSSSATSGNGSNNFDVFYSNQTPTTGGEGHYVTRAISGVGSAVKAHRHANCPVGDIGALISGAPTTQLLTYPNPADNAMIISPIAVCEVSTWRGVLRGAYFIPHNALLSNGIAHKDKVTSTVGLTGRKILTLALCNTGCGAIDITGPWA